MKIAVLGYGTVAKGAIKALEKTNIEVSRILVRSDKPGIEAISTRNFSDIINDPEIFLVAELMGGEEPAFSYVTAAMKAGKHVVSANKQMISRHYSALLQTAEECGVQFAFSAAAGGGIPWLVNLLRSAQADTAKSVYGIMNGTTNFILDAMQSDGKDFAPTLKLAQELGYAEADPTADIDGLDVRAKLALSVDIAVSGQLDPNTIPSLGIRYITKSDIDYFKSQNLSCRLIGRGDLENGVSAYVEPMLFPDDSIEAGIKGAGNVITAEFAQCGKLSFKGAGAGGDPTGTAVAGDICDIIYGITQFSKAKARSTITNNPGLIKHRYYLRIGTGVEIVTATVEEMHRLVGDTLKDGKECFAASFAE